jgi:hypothetical protein
MDYQLNEDSSRPFRIWNARLKKPVPWRCYKYWKRAILGTLMELKWAPIGTVLEVVDIRTGKLIGQYTRTINSIIFNKESERGIKDVE